MRGIERKYKDLATIKRKEKALTDYGETRSLSLTAVYENVPCRISQKQLPSNNQREPANEINYETKLFISSKITIMQGDTIEVTRGSTVRTYKAGEPFIYATHQEVILLRTDRA